jgi:hypothetical protein
MHHAREIAQTAVLKQLPLDSVDGDRSVASTTSRKPAGSPPKSPL